jgi:hypothetical protein
VPVTASLAAMQMSGTMAGRLTYPLLVGSILEWAGGNFTWPIVGSGGVDLLAVAIVLALVRDVAPLPIPRHGNKGAASRERSRVV